MATINFTNIDPAGQTNRYSFIIEGFIYASTDGVYTFETYSDENFLNFTDEKYDAFLKSAEMARDEDEKLSKYAEAHKYLIEQSVIIPMLHPVSLALIRSEFRDAVDTMFDFQGAWTFD